MKSNCRIERETVKMLRRVKEQKIREQLRNYPEKDKRDVISKMIEKENAISEENR